MAMDEWRLLCIGEMLCEGDQVLLAGEWRPLHYQDCACGARITNTAYYPFGFYRRRMGSMECLNDGQQGHSAIAHLARRFIDANPGIPNWVIHQFVAWVEQQPTSERSK